MNRSRSRRAQGVSRRTDAGDEVPGADEPSSFWDAFRKGLAAALGTGLAGTMIAVPAALGSVNCGDVLDREFDDAVDNPTNAQVMLREDPTGDITLSFKERVVCPQPADSMEQGIEAASPEA